jgi:hypothetical protein
MAFRQKRLFLLAVITAVTLLSSFVVVGIYAGWSSRWEGEVNGSVSAILIDLIIGPPAVFMSIAGLFTIGVAAIRGGLQERIALVVVVLAISMSCFVWGRRDLEHHYLNGLRNWASQVEPASVLAWATGATVGTTLHAAPPDWWLLAEPDRPFGVEIAPNLASHLFGGQLADDIRFHSDSKTVVFGWGYSGTRRRLLVITPPMKEPPAVFDMKRMSWVRVKNQVWIGLNESR